MNKGLQQAFAQFARNERWGTCGGCPRDSNGVPYPEFCASTDRYDHKLTLDDLVKSYEIYKRDEKE